MAKGTGGTIYLIGLIFAIIVAFVLLGVAYYMNTKWTEAEGKIATTEKALAAEKTTVQQLNTQIAQLSKIINGDTGGAGLTYDQVQQLHLAEADRALMDALSEEWISTAEYQAIKDPTVKEAWEVLAKFKDKPVKYESLMQFQLDCIKLLKVALHAVPRLRLAQYDALDRVAKLEKEIQDAKNTREIEVREANNKFNKLQDESIENQRKGELEKKHLMEQVEAARKETTRLVKEHANVEVRLRNDIQSRQRRIDELTKKQRKGFIETSQPDGEITYADAQLGYGWIDLGKVHGLRRGTRFQIYQYAKGGRQKVKGYCEVKKVEQDMAQVAILPDYEYFDPDTKERFVLPDPQDPVVKGDLIRSPVFEKDAQPKFYFLGQKLANRYYTKDELVKKIEEFGGKVLKELTVEVDFVVVLVKGEEDTKNYELATQLGATFMKEEELLDYIGK